MQHLVVSHRIVVLDRPPAFRLICNQQPLPSRFRHTRKSRRTRVLCLLHCQAMANKTSKLTRPLQRLQDFPFSKTWYRRRRPRALFHRPQL
jgi:hypothetical protein